MLFVYVLIGLMYGIPCTASTSGNVLVQCDPETKIIFESTEPENTILTRKKNTASIIFSGLASAASSVANIIVGDTQAKQAGVINIIGTACNVTAQLTEKSLPTRSNIRSAEFSQACSVLTNELFDALDKASAIRTPLPRTLALLKDIPAQSRAWVIDIILSSGAHAYAFLHDLFSVTQQCLSLCNEVVCSVANDTVDTISWLLDDTPTFKKID